MRLTDLDERFVHQLPEPLTTTAIEHEYWRESYFFILHERDRNDGDVLVVTMAAYPTRGILDSILVARVGGERMGSYATRPFEGDPHSTVVGPVTVDVVTPYRDIRVTADAAAGAAVGLDLRLTARTQPYGLRRGRLLDGAGLLLWDQSHMIQSVEAAGSYTVGGETRSVDRWWGQRDHSWGVRDHGRIPMWMWLAVQLPDGMLGVWCWEEANGARVYTDGCFAPEGGADPVPVVRFEHDLHWQTGGVDVDWGATTETGTVDGLAGRVDVGLADGTRVGLDARGNWCMPYGPFHGGGQHLMAVRADDGREGVASYEITGRDHHRYFPTPLSHP
jgi:hypothetical protein